LTPTSFIRLKHGRAAGIPGKFIPLKRKDIDSGNYSVQVEAFTAKTVRK
jgi:hypothetical protein